MSATVTTDVPLTAGAVRGRRSSAVLALARFEARELALQIGVLLGALLLVALNAWALFGPQDGMNDYPVLQDADRATQTTPLLFALVLLVCVNRAVLRGRRHDTEQQFGVLVVEPWRRTLAHGLSVLPFVAFTALVVLARFTVTALRPGAVGHGSPAELAVGPLVVLLGGCAGVLLARVFPSPLGPVLFVVAVCALPVIGFDESGAGGWRPWLMLTLPEEGGVPLPSALLGRPAAWHALYLAGLAALLLCGALLRAGGRSRAVRAAAVVALAATVVGVAGQSRGTPTSVTEARRTAARTPGKVQSCVTLDGSVYCSFPEWNGLRDDWAAVVDRVRATAGAEAAGAPLTVRQHVLETADLTSDYDLLPDDRPGRVSVGTRWGGNRVPEFAVGVATTLVAGDEKAAYDLCGAPMVTAMWLALAKEPAPLDSFRDVRIDDSLSGGAAVLTPTEPLSMSARETTVVREALGQPYGSVAAKVRSNWTELTTRGTSTARAAALLGVAVPRGNDSCER
ncbi:ABC transporter permease [Streptomyces sp. NPDC008150]|uniref:ABC transporter permease n=1 Tax=Streptomyces sp. NPDC008150 TaxID=3364816 RepID=UPI0036E5A91D